MSEILERVWKSIGGKWRWYILWLVNAKFFIGVSGIVLNAQDEILLLKHRFWNNHAWGLPSGHVKAGEELADALAREVREETGLEIGDIALIKLVSGRKLRIEASYLAHLAGGKLKIDPHEILDARFFPPTQLPEGILASHRDLIFHALSKGFD